MAENLSETLVTSSNLEGIAVSQLVPLAIDWVPIFCIAAACATGTTTIRGAEELRVKESDRIQAMAEGLTALGIKVKTFAGGLEIEGGPIFGGRVKSHSDHGLRWRFQLLHLKQKIQSLSKIVTMWLPHSLGL